jgi:hypothetical protein
MANQLFNNQTNTCYNTNSYLSEGGKAFVMMCDLSPVSFTDITLNTILEMDTGVLTNTYSNDSYCNSDVVSFSAVLGDYCFQNTSVNTPPGSLFQCYKSPNSPYYIPTYTEFASSTCSIETGHKNLNTTCTVLSPLYNSTLDVGYYEQTSCFTQTVYTNPGYAFQTVFADESCNSVVADGDGGADSQLGIMTYECLPTYDKTGSVVGSTYATCTYQTTTFTSYSSGNCAPDSIVESFSIDNNVCYNNGTFIPSLGKSQITKCLESPSSYNDTSVLIAEVPILFDAVLTTSYSIGGGCSSDITGFSAIAVSTCYNSSYNSTSSQGKLYTCSSNVPSYYEYITPISSNDSCSGVPYGKIDLNTICETLPFFLSTTSTFAYYAVTGCYIANPSPPPPTPPPTPTTLSYVFYQFYYNADCTGTTANTVIYVQNACLDYSITNSSNYYSNKYTCSNNIPYGNSYTGSANCTGLPSTYSYPVTCTR